MEVDIMISFTNIRLDKDFIYADAYDVDCKVSAKIKLSKHQEKLKLMDETSKMHNIIQGCWKLQGFYEDNGNKFPRLDRLDI